MLAGGLSIPGVVNEQWLFHISMPLCLAWTALFLTWVFIKFMLPKRSDNWKIGIDPILTTKLGELMISNKLFISDGPEPQFEFSASGIYNVYVCGEKQDIEMLAIIPQSINQNLFELLKASTLCNCELIVESGNIFVYTKKDTVPSW